MQYRYFGRCYRKHRKALGVQRTNGDFASANFWNTTFCKYEFHFNAKQIDWPIR